jgi:hypothetical protein
MARIKGGSPTALGVRPGVQGWQVGWHSGRDRQAARAGAGPPPEAGLALAPVGGLPSAKLAGGRERA